MMEKIAINPTTLAAPVGPFDRAVRIGPWLFIAGTSALTHLAGDFFERPLAPTIEEQARQTFLNIKAVCEAAGYDLDHIFEIRYTLKRREDIRKVHAVIREFLPKRGFISSAYQGEMLREEMLIEIEANAYKA